jgi:hypothetical protein
VTRLLDQYGSSLAALAGQELIEAIRESDGRSLLAEVDVSSAPLFAGTANAEIAAAFGADLICLNHVDINKWGDLERGLEHVRPGPEGFFGLCRLLGRPIGLNLEPDIDAVPAPFRATTDNALVAAAAGASFVVVTANPGRAAGLEDVATAVQTVVGSVPDLCCWAGKMHSAGAEEKLGPESVARLVSAGAQGVLVPLPGTMPGVSEEQAKEMVEEARSAGALAIGTIGTSQEGADSDTLRHLALTAKRIGVDVHHLGDAGLGGMAAPESLYAYSIAVRGIRHTWNRMARGTRASWPGKE